MPVPRRSVMFIALNHNHSALQRSAMCSGIIYLHAAPTERTIRGLWSYKHIALPEQGSSITRKIFVQSRVERDQRMVLTSINSVHLNASKAFASEKPPLVVR